MKCHYCGKEIKENKGKIPMAFVPETGMTIDFPFCNNDCLKEFRLKRGYDKSKNKKEMLE